MESSSRYKRPACSRCRRMKLRCDSGERFPAGCSRCTRAKKTCSMEPDYRSPSKDDRLEELEKELQTLRADLARQRSRSPRPGYSEDSANSRRSSFEMGIPATPAIEVPTHMTCVETRHLEGFEISPLEFDELVDMFFNALHPAFPFLADKPTVISDCVANQLLFWTIVAVASRVSPAHAHLYRQLLHPIRRLVMASIHDPDGQLQQIQALLILCVWPLPYGSSTDDPTWMYCGIASHKALGIGLHRVSSKQEFDPDYRSRPGKEIDRIRNNIWAACFVANHLVSQRHGVPSTMRMDQGLLRFIADPNEAFDPVLRQMLQIVQKDHALSLVLGHSEGTSDGLLPDPLPIIQAYETDLNILEKQLSRSWTPSVECTFLGSKLRLCTYALMKTGDGGAATAEADRSHTSLLRSTDISVYIARAYAASMRIIELCASEAQGRAAHPHGWGAWTSLDLHHLVYATFFLLEITRNWGMASDAVATNNAIRQAWSVLKARAAVEDDLFSQACAIIEQVSHGGLQPMPLDSPHALPQFCVKARMGANLIQDLVVRSKKRYDEGGLAYQSILPEPAAVAGMHSTSPAIGGGLGPDVGLAEYPGLALPTLDAKYFWAEVNGMGQQLPY